VFGREITGDKVAWWGARAIMEFPNFSLLHDRQSGDRINDRFEDWINTRGLPWLRNEVQRVDLRQDSSDVLAWDDGVYRIEASANCSYGYLYIGAIQRVADESTSPFVPILKLETCSDCNKKKSPAMKPFVPIKTLCKYEVSNRLVCSSCATKIIRRQRYRRRW
jgi:hypothetical protein